MPKLYRPTIPVETKCRVVLRQLGEMWPDRVIDDHRTMTGRLGRLLKSRLELYASMIRCEVKDLRLDHDPPLGARPKHRRGLGRKTFYIPDANDPDHLFYRPHSAQFDGSHDVKTRVRGDHGQFSDLALIKRERRRQKKKLKKAKKVWKRMKPKTRKRLKNALRKVPLYTTIYSNPKAPAAIAPGRWPKSRKLEWKR